MRDEKNALGSAEWTVKPMTEAGEEFYDAILPGISKKGKSRHTYKLDLGMKEFAVESLVYSRVDRLVGLVPE